MKRILLLLAFIAPAFAQTETLSVLRAVAPLIKCTTATAAAPQLLEFNGTQIICVAPPTVVLPTFVDGETPSGTINGTNTTFQLAGAPAPATSLHLYLNGLRLCTGTCANAADYTLSGQTINFASPPQPGDQILADYRLTP